MYDLDVELNGLWEALSANEKARHILYLKLLHRWKKLPDSHISLDEKKWIIRNCDLNTLLIPEHIRETFPLA